MASDKILGAIELTSGPCLMSLQEALFFRPDMELEFRCKYAKPIVMRLGGMMHQKARMPKQPGLDHWLLFGFCVIAPSALSSMLEKQVSVNYNPYRRVGLIRAEPALRMRGEEVFW